MGANPGSWGLIASRTQLSSIYPLDWLTVWTEEWLKICPSVYWQQVISGILKNIYPIMYGHKFVMICVFHDDIIKWKHLGTWDWWFETPVLPLWRHCNEGISLWIYQIIYPIFLGFSGTIIVRTLGWTCMNSTTNKLTQHTTIREYKSSDVLM